MTKWKVMYLEKGKKSWGTTYITGKLSEEEVIEFFGLKGPDVESYKVEKVKQ